MNLADMITRRDFLRLGRDAAMAIAVASSAYLDSQNVSMAQGNSEKAKEQQFDIVYYFDTTLSFYDITPPWINIESKIGLKAKDRSYSCELRVFEDGNENMVVYQHSSEGRLNGQELLPKKSTIQRNFYWWWLFGWRRTDKFELEFEDVNEKLVKVKSKDSYGNKHDIPYASNSQDALTAIVQLLLDRKNDKKQGHLQLTDKLGRPKTAFAEYSEDTVTIDLKGEQFDFKKITIKFKKGFEPLKITIEGLYDGLANLEMTRR